MTTVLGFETSCDETGVGIVRDGVLLADALASSVDEHARFGGVVPEVAARAHVSSLVPTVHPLPDRVVGLPVSVAYVRAMGFAMLGVFATALTVIAVFYVARAWAVRGGPVRGGSVWPGWCVLGWCVLALRVLGLCVLACARLPSNVRLSG